MTEEEVMALLIRLDERSKVILARLDAYERVCAEHRKVTVAQLTTWRSIAILGAGLLIGIGATSFPAIRALIGIVA